MVALEIFPHFTASFFDCRLNPYPNISAIFRFQIPAILTGIANSITVLIGLALSIRIHQFQFSLAAFFVSSDFVIPELINDFSYKRTAFTSRSR